MIIEHPRPSKPTYVDPKPLNPILYSLLLCALKVTNLIIALLSLWQAPQKVPPDTQKPTIKPPPRTDPRVLQAGFVLGVYSGLIITGVLTTALLLNHIFDDIF